MPIIFHAALGVLAFLTLPAAAQTLPQPTVVIERSDASSRASLATAEPYDDADALLQRHQRTARRLMRSMCYGCLPGQGSRHTPGAVPREMVGPDGLAYRAEDLK
jgi:hypothetical protein